jgi:hypothetical protein
MIVIVVKGRSNEKSSEQQGWATGVNAHVQDSIPNRSNTENPKSEKKA